MTDPSLVVRVKRDFYTIDGATSLIQLLRKLGPKPPPHPMILGTVVGVTLRNLRGEILIGKELLLPSPCLRWAEVTHPRIVPLWRYAQDLAQEMETMARLRDMIYDPTSQDCHALRTQHPIHTLCHNASSSS